MHLFSYWFICFRLSKKFINPEVRVAYEYKYYYLQKTYYPNKKEENAYKNLYEESKSMQRNKDMSNYKDKKISLNNELNNFYLSNKLQTYNNSTWIKFCFLAI